MNIEALLMQALDGTISAAFERMLAVDTALRRAPVVAPPDGFAAAVTTRVRRTPIAQPIKRRYIFTLIPLHKLRTRPDERIKLQVR